MSFCVGNSGCIHLIKSSNGVWPRHLSSSDEIRHVSILRAHADEVDEWVASNRRSPTSWLPKLIGLRTTIGGSKGVWVLFG